MRSESQIRLSFVYLGATKYRTSIRLTSPFISMGRYCIPEFAVVVASCFKVFVLLKAVLQVITLNKCLVSSIPWRTNYEWRIGDGACQ